MKKLFLTSFLLLCICGVLQAQVGITAVPFLQIEPDARASGMGNTGVAIADNAAAVFWNPAGLAFQQKNQVNLTHSQWLPQFNIDLFYDYLAGSYHIKDIGSFGAHITYLNLGSQLRTSSQNPTGEDLGHFNSYELAIGLSYGYKIDERWSVGSGVRYIHSSLANGEVEGLSIEPGSTFSFDLAGMFQSPSFRLFANRPASINAGVNISNIGPAITYTHNPGPDASNNDPQPTVFRIGWKSTSELDRQGLHTLTRAHDLSNILARPNTGAVSALFTSWGELTRELGEQSLHLNSLQQLMLATGLEYWFDNIFAVRSGYYYEDPHNGGRQFMTFGAGIRYKFIGFDFSYIYTLGNENHPLANTTRFGLIANF